MTVDTTGVIMKHPGNIFIVEHTPTVSQELMVFKKDDGDSYVTMNGVDYKVTSGIKVGSHGYSL